MTSKGEAENKKLKQNMESQLERLVQQLADLEESREEFEAEEYEETKQETMDQLREFQTSLGRLVSGDLSLVNDLAAIQLATQAAISQAFQIPAVLRMFARRQPRQLRSRLEEIEKDLRQSVNEREREKFEILTALRQLGETLSSAELEWLQKKQLKTDSHFVPVDEKEGLSGEIAIEMARKQARNLQ